MSYNRSTGRRERGARGAARAVMPLISGRINNNNINNNNNNNNNDNNKEEY